MRYLGIERERKFLLKKLPDLSKAKKKQITQKYLSSEPELRVRKIGEDYVITKKGPGTHTRTEEEMAISSELFLFLEGDQGPMRINKIRYFLPLDEGRLAEIDVYEEEFEGFYSVEVEFESDADMKNFEPPGWFGLEVTERRDITNYQMAKNGIPKDLKEVIDKYNL